MSIARAAADKTENRFSGPRAPRRTCLRNEVAAAIIISRVQRVRRDRCLISSADERRTESRAIARNHRRGESRTSGKGRGDPGRLCPARVLRCAPAARAIWIREPRAKIGDVACARISKFIYLFAGEELQYAREITRNHVLPAMLAICKSTKSLRVFFAREEGSFRCVTRRNQVTRGQK